MSSLASSEEFDVLRFENAKVLYESKCKNCHGELSNAQFAGQPPEQITLSMINSALSNVFSMQSLSSGLSPSDKNELMYAFRNYNQTPVGNPDENKYKCLLPDSRGRGFTETRRFLRSEFTNALTSLLGTTVMNDAEIRSLLQGLPVDEMITGSADLSPTHAPNFPRVLYNISKRAIQVLGTNGVASFFPTCAAGTTVDNCYRSNIQRVGQKAYGRPLTAAEVESFVVFNQTVGAGTTGQTSSLMRLIASPQLVFHIENQGQVQGDRVRLTAYEVASRISYLVSESPPDEALLQAALLNELNTVAQVKTQVQRLMASHPKAQQRILAFFKSYGGVLNAGTPFPPAVANAGLTGASASNLPTEMATEANDFLNHIVLTTKGNFKDLMTSRAAFPKSQAMANILGTSVMQNGQPTMTNGRGGLFLRPAFLADTDKRTNIIKRGVKLRIRYLCDELGNPPAGAEAEKDNVMDPDSIPNRTLINLVTNKAACISCHGQINPLGFSLEGFDQLGRQREVESLFNADGSFSRMHSIDTRVDNPRIDTNGATAINDHAQLIEEFAKSRKARACLVKNAYDYYRVKKISPDDYCSMGDSETLLQSGSLYDLIISTVANDDIFWRKGVSP